MMKVAMLSPDVGVSPQLAFDDIAEVARQGFRSIVCNRPDGEERDQPTAAVIASAAAVHGLAFAHLPVVSGSVTDDDAGAMRPLLTDLPGPLLAYCRTGTRSATLWALGQDGEVEQTLAATEAAGYDLKALRPRLVKRGAGGASRTFDVVVVGGGSAGIAVAASLLRRAPKLSIAVVEPAERHYYQPGWTLVGAGVFKPEATCRPESAVMPHGVEWHRVAATGFVPDSNEVHLLDGKVLTYRALVVAAGIRLAWEAIPGLVEALGHAGVTSNYRYDLAPYTNELVRNLRHGRALFSQPPMPIKCAGAPQKAMYLSCDIWRGAGVLRDIDVSFHNAGAVLFGVPAYVPALNAYIERYGIDLRLQSTLVRVDGVRRVAVFDEVADGQVARIEREFDMLHAVPPQVPPEVIADSPLAGPSGFVEVDGTTLRHVRHANVFALGDVAGTSNAKTAAAARKQAPVVALNVLAALDGKPPVAGYDGYGSCPLTVERGKIVLAEFGYGGKLLPSFPAWLLDGTRRAGPPGS